MAAACKSPFEGPLEPTSFTVRTSASGINPCMFGAKAVMHSSISTLVIAPSHSGLPLGWNVLHHTADGMAAMARQNGDPNSTDAVADFLDIFNFE